MKWIWGLLAKVRKSCSRDNNSMNLTLSRPATKKGEHKVLSERQVRLFNRDEKSRETPVLMMSWYPTVGSSKDNLQPSGQFTRTKIWTPELPHFLPGTPICLGLDNPHT